jgi:hypothetical protein
MSVSRYVVVLVLFFLTPQLARADVVLEWNMRMFQTLAGQSPFATARFAAITQLAVFEAVNAITQQYERHGPRIPASVDASVDAAAVSAAHGVLAHYFPLQAAALGAALAASLSAIPDDTAKTDGVAVGVAAAKAMIALRENDGALMVAFFTPNSTDVGQWQRTPSCPAGGGTNYHWRLLKPFAIPSPSAFRLGPPPGVSQGTYTKDFAEVMQLGEINSAVRSLDRENIARFYAAFSPVAWVNSVARQIAMAESHHLVENARALALINMALSDAAVATFDTKYHYTLWRPETAIKAADTDGNDRTAQDAGYLPLIVAPCFPGYPSAHGTLSSAGAEVLERLYGPNGHDLEFSIASMPEVTLRYSAIKRIVGDISDARVYGGIHFRFDQVGGEHQGTEVGKYVFKHYLRPVVPN